MRYLLFIQGVQAQTVANFYGAMDADLTIVPVINKVFLLFFKLIYHSYAEILYVNTKLLFCCITIILFFLFQIDLASANVESCIKQLESVFDFKENEIQLVRVSFL